MADSKSAMTPIGTLCFPALFEPKAPAQGAEPRYSCILVFDDIALKTAAYQNLRKAVMEAITEKWGAAKAQDQNFLRTLRLPFRPTAEKEYTGFDRGDIFISPWSKSQPGIVDVQGTDIKVAGDVFAGQQARATVRAFAYEQSGNKGVAFGLEHLQIVKADAERIDGRRSAQAAFAEADDDELKARGIDANASLPATGTDLPF